MASLELEFGVQHDSITLSFSGFNDSLGEFVNQAFEWISGFSKLEEERMREIFS